MPPATTRPVLIPACMPKSEPFSALNASSVSIISNAVRRARAGSSSWAMGAPNKAIISSPMNLSTTPPYFSTMGTSRSKQLFIKLRTCSGSIFSDIAVKPEISANMTVTTRRSPANWASGAGGGSGGGDGGVEETAVPHCIQNFACDGKSA